ncbi:hypothetical protein [Okeania sp. KiyG1]|uniref:hypothetical protein n=1 Tax=Okeania sp. KiyG1 TaxID=2720165 RepID=UPI0019248B4A|nr:hypothetical protein [Okeania sp. KiyG1]GGA46059.1 hypothetical protein CYANOKiyG1_65030 [Okeania sp. KiyG1]
MCKIETRWHDESEINDIPTGPWRDNKRSSNLLLLAYRKKGEWTYKIGTYYVYKDKDNYNVYVWDCGDERYNYPPAFWKEIKIVEPSPEIE